MGRLITNLEFIRRVTDIHKGKYSYCNCSYIGMAHKVIITCPIHGDFEQLAMHHNKGHGCSKCRSLKMSETLRSSTAEFVSKANVVHDNKYLYSKSIYTLSTEKLIIICKIHGEFTQTPGNHLSGTTCPECANIIRTSTFITDKPTDLYYIKITNLEGISLYKIGITTTGWKKRYSKELRAGYAIRILKVIKYSGGLDAWVQEQLLLLKYRDFKYKGEVFLPQGGDTELFTKDVLNLEEEADDE